MRNHTDITDSVYIINRLLVRPVKITGSMWETKTYTDGCIRRLVGCQFKGKASKKASDLIPGARITCLDYTVEQIVSKNGDTYERISIYDFKEVRS